MLAVLIGFVHFYIEFCILSSTTSPHPPKRIFSPLNPPRHMDEAYLFRRLLPPIFAPIPPPLHGRLRPPAPNPPHGGAGVLHGPPSKVWAPPPSFHLVRIKCSVLKKFAFCFPNLYVLKKQAYICWRCLLSSFLISRNPRGNFWSFGCLFNPPPSLAKTSFASEKEVFSDALPLVIYHVFRSDHPSAIHVKSSDTNHRKPVAKWWDVIIVFYIAKLMSHPHYGKETGFCHHG